MAIADIDPREVATAQATTTAAAPAAMAAADAADARSEALPPSAREAQLRHAARVRQAVVARWLRRLSD